MKFKNKILASLVAVVMLLGVVALPTKAMMKAFGATNATFSNESLVIKNFEKAYDLVDNKTLTYSDYVDGVDHTNIFVYQPNGEPLRKSNPESVTFVEPGLHAMYIRKETTEGFYIYSDVIYIPVSSGNMDKIELDGEFYPMVLPNSVVECPLPIDENGEVDSDVLIDVKIYTPYGEVVTANMDGATKRWKFTNKEGILGKYFIEYTKEVQFGGSTQTIYRYETIEFSPNATSTTSTKFYSQDTETGELKINIAQTGLDVKEVTNIYLFKYYNLDQATVIKKDGTIDTSASIYVSVYDEDDQKYYNFATGKFEFNSEDGAKILTSDTKVKNFNLQDIEHFKKNGLSREGHNIKFTFTATVDGNDLKATKTLKEDFNEEAVHVSTKELVRSEITDIIIVGEVESTVPGTLELPEIVIDIENGYNEDAIKNILKSVRVEITKSSETFSSKNERSDQEKTENKTGFDVTNKGDWLNQTYVFNYNKNMIATQNWDLRYIAFFGDTEDVIDEVRVTKAYTLYARTESQDQTPPHNLTINGGTLISTDGTYKVPTASVLDKDDNGKTTTGAKINISLISETGATTSVVQGEELEGLADGTYTLKYEAVDFKGNKRVKTVTFKVKADKAPADPTFSDNAITYEYEDGKVSVELNSTVDGVTIYGGEKGQFSPEKMTFVDGKLTAFEFKFDNTKGCTMVFKNSNSKSIVYRAVNLFNTSVDFNIKAIICNQMSSGYTKLTPNTVIEVKPFQKLIWAGSNSFELVAPENALYTISDSNEFTFKTVGTYIITSTEVYEVNGQATSYETTTTINVKNSTTAFDASLPIGHKLVAKTGETIKLNVPVVTNYFGHKISCVVKDSAGRDVTSECLKNKLLVDSNDNFLSADFVAPRNDEYTVIYTFTGDDMARYTYPIVITTGNVALPQISIAETNESVLWEGEIIKYVLKNATAIDKNGKAISVAVKVFDQYGKELEVKAEAGNKYVDIKGAGFYTIRYTAVDADGQLNFVESVFAVEFPEEEEKDGLSAWAIIGIILGSIAGAGAVAGLVLLVIKHNKKKTRFINKSKQAKKQEKKDVAESVKVYTVAESKDEKHWLAKAGNRTIAKVLSKQEAIDKIKEVHKKGEYSIKVYNKNGRLVDSI